MIEWTDRTWNPVRGCSMAKGSEDGGCLNCYAARMAARNLPGMMSPKTGEAYARKTARGARWTRRVELIPSKLDEPLHWRKPRRIFVNSMSDLFHESLSDEAIMTVFAVMSVSPQHTFQILTKRPERALRWFGGIDSRAGTMNGLRSDRLYILRGAASRYLALGKWPTDVHAGGMDWPLPNVWLGVSAENQAAADERIPLLLQTPAAVRFVSLEPLLGPITFLPSWVAGYDYRGGLKHSAPRLDWVIVGGESGPGARPCDVTWIRDIVRQCREAGVPCFVKQDSGPRPGGRGLIPDDLWAAKEYPHA